MPLAILFGPNNANKARWPSSHMPTQAMTYSVGHGALEVPVALLYCRRLTASAVRRLTHCYLCIGRKIRIIREDLFY